MEKIVFNEDICGRNAIVKEMDMPFGHYYTGYIEILPSDPVSWIIHVGEGEEIFFDSFPEFEEFPGGVTFVGHLGDDGKMYVGFDTEPFLAGEYDKDDCLDILDETATRLAIRTRATKEAMNSLKHEKEQNDGMSKNVGLLLEAVVDLGSVDTCLKLGKKYDAEPHLQEAGSNLIQYLKDELGVSMGGILLYTALKRPLMKHDSDKDSERG